MFITRNDALLVKIGCYAGPNAGQAVDWWVVAASRFGLISLDLGQPAPGIGLNAAINKGNSGGPMFNKNGEVIGIVSSILSQSGGFEGVGFAASINVAKELLINQKPVWIGVDPYFVAGKLAQALNLPQEAGVLIQRVAQNSPGYHLGFRPSTIPAKIGDQELFIGGDIVLEVQGIPVSLDPLAMEKIRKTLTAHPDLTNLEFTVLRDGKIVKLHMSQ